MFAKLLSYRKMIIGGIALTAVVVGMLTLFVRSGRSDVPGAPPTFTALTTGKPVLAASLPTDVHGFVEQAAARMEMNPATASAHVYLVRSSMGEAGLDMYAFADSLGRPCFIVSTEAGTCDVNNQTLLPGFYWLLGGGDGGTAPSYLLAMAGDNIQVVKLTIDGSDIPVSLQNNVAFAEFPNTAKSATVTVHYTDGTEKSASFSLD